MTCTKPIFNIAILCWDSQAEKNLLASLFGNDYEISRKEIIDEENKEDFESCQDTSKTISSGVLKSSSTKTHLLNTDLFKQIFSYQGHVHLLVFHNEIYNNQLSNYHELIKQLSNYDVVLFDISINTPTLKEELDALTLVCEQICAPDLRTKLLILIDDCNTLKYCQKTNNILFSRQDNESIKEETLCIQLLNLLKNKTSKYRMDDNFIKLSSMKASVYNNFSTDLVNLTSKQIDYLGVTMCGSFSWSILNEQSKISKLKQKINDLSEEEFKLHAQCVCNTGFIKLSDKIKIILLDINVNGNNCMLQHIKRIIFELLIAFKITEDEPLKYYKLLIEKNNVFEDLETNTKLIKTENTVLNNLIIILINHIKLVCKWPSDKFKHDIDHNKEEVSDTLIQTYLMLKNLPCLNKRNYNVLLFDIITHIYNYCKYITNLEELFDFVGILQSHTLIFKEFTQLFKIIIYSPHYKITPKMLLELLENITVKYSLDQTFVNEFISYWLMHMYSELGEIISNKKFLCYDLKSVYANFYEYNNIEHSDSQTNIWTFEYLFYKINKFWSNSLLAVIIDEDSTLSKIAFLVNQCYKSCDNTCLYRFLNLKVNFTKIYDLTLEEYLVNNIKK